MKIDNFNQNHNIESQDLERKINLLRSKIDNKQGYFICEQDIVGIKIECLTAEKTRKVKFNYGHTPQQ